MSRTLITHDGQTRGATEWARKHRVPPHALLRFLREGLDFERAVAAARAASVGADGRPHSMDAAQLREAEAMRQSGHPLRVVAARLGVSMSTISRQLAARGGGVALLRKKRTRRIRGTTPRSGAR